MTSESSLLARQMADVELRPFTLDEFHRRRHQKQRNRKIAIGVTGVLVLAVVAGGVLRSHGEEDQQLDATVLGPLESPFAGEWVSTDIDGSSQTMTILRTDGDAHEVVVHDEAALVCSDRPSTLTGAGKVETLTVLVIDAELTCDDGTTPDDLEGTPEGLRLDALDNLIFVHDPETDTLRDSTGGSWARPGDTPPDDADAAIGGPSPFEGSWVSGGVAAAPGGQNDIAPESMQIRHVADGDAHEIEVHQSAANRCSGAPATVTGTGRREVDSLGLVHLVVTGAVTCDDGSEPVPMTPEEEELLDDLQQTFLHDPVTDELVGSLGNLFWREGTERKQGDPMPTVGRLIAAINARDVDAFTDLFAPDGGFEVEGGFSLNAFASWQPVSEDHLVQVWMAMQEAWDFQAEVLTCTPAPGQRPYAGTGSDAEIECEVAIRWPKLSLEITARWSYELRGERLLYWHLTPLDLEPPGRALPLGYPDLMAWEAWLEANHPEDADRWLNLRRQPADDCCEDADDPERQALWESLLLDAYGRFAVEDVLFAPSGLIPYDPEFADDIEASIDEYLASG